jgi:hypothetical protein
MSVRNNAAERIAAFVAAHPGCTRAELLAGLGVTDPHWAMPTYCVRSGRIHRAGPRSSTRYYASAEAAAAAHAAIVKATAQRRQAKKREQWRKDNLRKRAQRHANGSRPTDTRPGHHVYSLPPGAKLAPDARITVAPPLRDRWAA